MRKTKQQLIDIILRKDEVHKKLNDDIDKLHKEKDYLNTRLNAYINHVDELAYDKNALVKELEEAAIKTNDLTEACDEYASRIQEYIDDIKHYKRLSILTGSVTIIILLVLLLSL